MLNDLGITIPHHNRKYRNDVREKGTIAPVG